MDPVRWVKERRGRVDREPLFGPTTMDDLTRQIAMQAKGPETTPLQLAASIPAGAFAGERKRWEEYEELRSTAKMYGLDVIPGEAPEALRGRIEDYLAGGRATFNGIPFPCLPIGPEEQAIGQAITARLGTGAPFGPSVMGEVMRQIAGQGPPDYSRVTTTTAHIPAHERESIDTVETKTNHIRAENRRLGEEIAKAPPEWAYPLAWRLAVMAVVEARNDKGNPSPFRWTEEEAALMREYHMARIDGLLPDDAAKQAVIIADVGELDGDRICQAYERGRPGPGGCKVGRSA